MLKVSAAHRDWEPTNDSLCFTVVEFNALYLKAGYSHGLTTQVIPPNLLN